jgi:hypothetical protein
VTAREPLLPASEGLSVGRGFGHGATGREKDGARGDGRTAGSAAERNRHGEEPGEAEGFDVRGRFEMAADALRPRVDAEHRLGERTLCGRADRPQHGSNGRGEAPGGAPFVGLLPDRPPTRRVDEAEHARQCLPHHGIGDIDARRPTDGLDPVVTGHRRGVRRAEVPEIFGRDVTVGEEEGLEGDPHRDECGHRHPRVPRHRGMPHRGRPAGLGQHMRAKVLRGGRVVPSPLRERVGDGVFGMRRRPSDAGAHAPRQTQVERGEPAPRLPEPVAFAPPRPGGLGEGGAQPATDVLVDARVRLRRPKRGRRLERGAR